MIKYRENITPGIFDEPKIFTLLNCEERRTRIQYRPDGLFLFNVGGRPERDPSKDKIQLMEARKKRFQGDLSGSAKKNLVRAFDNLLLISKQTRTFNRYIGKQVNFQLAMITLTLPTDKTLSSKETNKRLLKRFLQFIENYSIKQHRKKLTYLWKLELQERGQLHYHIILNRFIPYELINKFWSYLLEDTGLSREYFLKYNSRNVKQAARVESVKKNTSGEMRSYMLKRYLKKRADQSLQNEMKERKTENKNGKITGEQLTIHLSHLQNMISQIDGSVWGCSDCLKEKYPTMEMDFATYLRMKDFCELYPNLFIHFEFCMIIQDAEKKPPDKLISQKFKAIIRANRDFIEFGGSNAVKKLCLN